MSDRQVHGRTNGGNEIVRYDRAGKWFLEGADGARMSLTLNDAARRATSGAAFLGLPGGKRFDAAVRRLRA